MKLIDWLALPALFVVAGYGAVRRVLAGDALEDVKRDAIYSRFTYKEQQQRLDAFDAWMCAECEKNNALRH